MQRLEAIGRGLESRAIGALSLGEFVLAVSVHRPAQVHCDVDSAGARLRGLRFRHCHRAAISAAIPPTSSDHGCAGF
jgi:hypothetical protein